MNSEKIAIAIFNYNRPEKTKLLIKSLLQNPEISDVPVYFFVDSHSKVSDKEQTQATVQVGLSLVKDINIKVFQPSYNLGTDWMIRLGVSEVLASHESVIVLEDDLLCSRDFLRFMFNSLETLSDQKRIFQISGYSYPISSKNSGYYLLGSDCWGWATWREKWRKVNWSAIFLVWQLLMKGKRKTFDRYGRVRNYRLLIHSLLGLNRSWAIRLHAFCVLNDYVTYYPKHSMIKNLGFDGGGVHSGLTNKYDVDFWESYDIFDLPKNIALGHESDIDSFFEELDVDNSNISFVVYFKSILRQVSRLVKRSIKKPVFLVIDKNDEQVRL